MVGNRLSLKSGDNAESHLPGLREVAERLGHWVRGKQGGNPGLIAFRGSEKLPNLWPKLSLQESE